MSSLHLLCYCIGFCTLGSYLCSTSGLDCAGYWSRFFLALHFLICCTIYLISPALARMTALMPTPCNYSFSHLPNTQRVLAGEVPPPPPHAHTVCMTPMGHNVRGFRRFISNRENYAPRKSVREDAEAYVVGQ